MGDDFNDFARGKTDEQLRSEFDGAHASPNGAGHKKTGGPCLSLADWLACDIPAPDFLLGELLSTTTRMELVAPTGLGKTNFVMAVGLAIAAGCAFLHWVSRRPARVLFIDGEMSRRLMKIRLEDAARRLGAAPGTFFVLCRDDDNVENIPPLNTAEGQAFIDGIIEQLGGVDLIIFDNVMSLIAGVMKDEDGWSQTLPWIKRLTKRSIGQIWVHHTGHEQSHSYGTSTREWQLDTVALMQPIERPGADIAFTIKFPKARERSPHNRADFEQVTITLSRDEWAVEQSDAAKPKKKVKGPSPLAVCFHKALLAAIVGSGVVRPESAGCRSVTKKEWERECERRGLIETAKPNSQRSLLSKYGRELVATELAVFNDDFIWNRAVSA